MEMFKATWRPLRAEEMLVNAMKCGHPGCNRLATAVAVEEIVPPDGKYRCDDPEHRHPLVIGSNPAGSAMFEKPPAPMAVVVRYNPGSSAAEVLQDLETHLFDQEGATLNDRKLLVKASLRFVRHLLNCGHAGVDVVLPAGVNLRGVEVVLATGSIVVIPWPGADDEELNVYAPPVRLDSQPAYVLRPRKVEPPGGIAVDMRRGAEMARKDAPDPDGPTLGEMNAILRGAMDAIPRGTIEIKYASGSTMTEAFQALEDHLFEIEKRRVSEARLLALASLRSARSLIGRSISLQLNGDRCYSGLEVYLTTGSLCALPMPGRADDVIDVLVMPDRGPLDLEQKPAYRLVPVSLVRR